MTFKVGIFSDMLDARGKPTFGRKALEVLNVPGIAWEWIEGHHANVTPDLAARYDGLHVNLQKVTAAAVSRPDCRLKIIARNGVGYDAVDHGALAARGVVVTNTPIAVRRPLAVATLTMIFALSGRLIQKQAITRAGRYNDRNNYMGQGLTTRTLALIGAGGIGRELIGLARPFFGRIIAADPYADKAQLAAMGVDLLPLEDVMRQGDFVVALCLLTDETRHLVNAARLAMMKPTAYYLNMARGPVTDEKALIAALQSGQIAGAGLDVTEKEPIEDDNPLLAMDNVIVTPHALCWTDECFHDIATSALTSIVDVAQGRRPQHVVDPIAWDNSLKQ